MCTRPLTIRVPPNPYEYSLGFRGMKEVKVPCGKYPSAVYQDIQDIYHKAP